MKNSIYLLLSLLIFFACSGARKAVTTSKSPDCPTVVEGFFYSKKTWDHKVPALIIKTENGEKTVTGKSIEQTSEGIVFDPDKEGPFYNPPELLYAYDEIIFAIDENLRILHGELPEGHTTIWNMEFVIVPAEKPNAKPIRLPLKANERFSYCLEPGHYTVKSFVFKNKKGYVDNGFVVQSMEFDVERGKLNYIGDLYLNYEPYDHPDVYLIPYKVHYRPSHTYLATTFGLVGSLLSETVLKGAAGVHALSVKVAPEFSSELKLPIKVTPVQFEKRKMPPPVN